MGKNIINGSSMVSINTLYPGRSHKQFVPQRSGLHRQAVFALYRALLSQCSAVPSDDVEKDALKHVTRNRFRANRHLRSPRRLKLSFYAGYKALDHLDDAVIGDEASINRITGYLSKIPAFLKQAPKVASPPPKRDYPPYVTPPEHQFFNVFPREHVGGKRRVPNFVRANGFPMVRWKKPQPEKLTRTLTGLLKNKQKNINHQMDYDEYHVPMARNEDMWDHIVQQQLSQGSQEAGSTWARDAGMGLREIKKTSIERHKRTMEKAHKMVEIVEKERELAEADEHDNKGR